MYEFIERYWMTGCLWVTRLSACVLAVSLLLATRTQWLLPLIILAFVISSEVWVAPCAKARRRGQPLPDLREHTLIVWYTVLRAVVEAVDRLITFVFRLKDTSD